MDLFYRIRGEGEPLLLLHGLFGSADNLGGIARLFEEQYQVISVDMRNHGRSPHDGGMSYSEMAEDVIRVMDKEGISEAYVLGHSMGGKAAMQLALSYPDRVKKLIVGDIAPVKYGAHHDSILKGMQEVAEQSPQSRKGAEEILMAYESEPAVLSFLLTNWRRTEEGTWAWRVNLRAIVDEYHNIAAAMHGGPFEKPVLFMRGGNSEYVQAEHRDAILSLFPQAAVRTIENTGHWLHAEKPDMFARAVIRFLSS
ncbi:alpha/beta fold hydrolase [Kordiimonas sp. SCSIO 12603]|uniref:alpha/beta fold hydrolase n=1 Tax=Kordiimonas sp. SCSIO 12603 TaxID=2829596 RepID=UPI0021034498|nr:alpha/beta fold hydrolase [Kordiimonas sp. SCSIO 12603]UTW57977.1 alpha/beta fold hydrolase [Kordiimonas sp. SCSIO 12603]